ncbi:uncharacterized protein DDB_G0280315-like [Chrysoperla carnea]|uniref:uncharacterized protein DDB_G0280315-like n=1 Tax=Chrysoperla carnea TaxID=189513 RepID=UPI001D05F213|nr:uncharacterized protein DDB_G0280315-like [Chrysoperla carnea]
MVKDSNNINGTNVQKINHKNTWHNSRYSNSNKNTSTKLQKNIENCAELLNKLQMNNNNQNKKTYNRYTRNKNEGQTKTADNNCPVNQSKKHKQKSFQNNYSSQNMLPQLNVVRHIMMQEKIWPYTYCKMPTINFILPHLLNTVVYVVYPGYGIQRSNPNIQIQIPKPKENNKQLKNVSCFNCGSSGHLGNDCTEPSMEELLLHDTYRLNYLSSSDVYFQNLTSSTSSSSELLDKI